MIYTEIFDTVPYVKPDFAKQFEVGRRFTCSYGRSPAELVILNGKKAMQVSLPWHLINDYTAYNLSRAGFDDDETLAALTVDNNDSPDNT